jgi:ring-1,2-phenylacetyl-CoA epoxidase subunit PaaD
MVTGSAVDPPVRDDATRAAARAAIWRALAGVVDPEIPAVSIVELGIVRDVALSSDAWVVTVTPTYSGCPATRIIEADIRTAVAAAIGEDVRIVTALAPAWTTDWIAPEGRLKLREAGIAPPHAVALAGSTQPQPVTFRRPREAVRCPNCGSLRTTELARFGSTACKAQYRCTECLEPFDFFKPH